MATSNMKQRISILVREFYMKISKFLHPDLQKRRQASKHFLLPIQISQNYHKSFYKSTLYTHTFQITGFLNSRNFTHYWNELKEPLIQQRYYAKFLNKNLNNVKKKTEDSLRKKRIKEHNQENKQLYCLQKTFVY